MEEAVSHVLHRALDLALGARAVRTAQSRPEAALLGQTDFTPSHLLTVGVSQPRGVQPFEKGGFDVLSQQNFNRPLKAVDLPKSKWIIENINKFFVKIIFLLSVFFYGGMDQIIICRKLKN